MKRMGMAVLAALVMSAGVFVACEKQDGSSEAEAVATSKSTDESATIWGGAWAQSGDWVYVDFVAQWEGWPPETSGPEWASCWTGDMDCTCPGGMCWMRGIVEVGNMDPSVDPSTIQDGMLYLDGAQLVMGFSSDPSVVNPPAHPNPIVPITANFHVDPSVAAGLGYSDIEIHAGNYLTDYTHNANGEIHLNATFTP